MNKIDTGDLASESDDDNVPSKKEGDPTTDFTKWLKKNHNKGPRDLKGDEYTKHSKAFQAQKKAKEADDTMDVKIGPDGSIQKADLAEPEDTRSAGEKLEELVKSYYDYTTNNFPKGEQAVVTACEKEFGEESVPVAEKMIARLSFTDFDGKKFMDEYEKNPDINNEIIKRLAPKVVEGVDRLKKWSESL